MVSGMEPCEMMEGSCLRVSSCSIAIVAFFAAEAARLAFFRSFLRRAGDFSTDVSSIGSAGSVFVATSAGPAAFVASALESMGC